MPNLPDFEAPPLTEVALSVQFDTLDSFSVHHVGLLWQEYRDRFPVVEQHQTLPSVIERFADSPGQREISLSLVRTAPLPRVWFLGDDGTELVQIQADRFIYNWRKSDGDDQYPRYGSVVARQQEELARFSDFANNHALGPLKPSQCEVTYVNLIELGDGGAQDILTVLAEEYSDDYLPAAESAGLALAYTMALPGGHPGRLHVSANTKLTAVATGTPVMRLTLTARGAPLDGEDGIRGLFDAGREWIVRGFCSITTAKMHALWGRKS
ncbi:MAG: TIGR04255 family protein [bacterium]|nr:TIGR04255 family protein [bacterium]